MFGNALGRLDGGQPAAGDGVGGGSSHQRHLRDHLEWTLKDGVLAISGTGMMYYYEYEKVPWIDHFNSITSVVIADGVTSIGSYAFAGCGSLTNVTIPESVTSIEHNAFEHCESLASVNFPGKITSIGMHSFAYCTSLTSVMIPGSVTTIGNVAFRDCVNLKSVVISDGVTSIGQQSFMSCTSLTSVTIPMIDKNHRLLSQKAVVFTQ